MTTTAQPAYSAKAQEIIARTNEMLAAGGYNGFSYADIAEQVGVRKASIHHHFAARSDLVRATVALHRQAVQQGLHRLDASIADPLDRLIAYCGYWAECISQARPSICICALLAAELPALPDDVAAEVTTHFRDLQAWVATTMAQGAARGVIRLTDSPEAEASVFVASVHGAMLSARAAGHPPLFRQIVQVATDRLKG